MIRPILLSMVLSILAFAGDAAPPADSTSILFPSTGAGGKMGIWSSGSVVGNGDGWAQGQPGQCQFRVEWVDMNDEFHIATCVWSVDVPAGRLVLGAAKDGEELTLTLTKLGEYAPLLKSDPFDIVQGQKVDGHQEH
jgi:hypothetical protein